MKKQHFKIHLNEVTEEQLNEAPAIVRKVYNAIRNNEKVDMKEKEIAVKFHDFFNLIPVAQPSFSQAQPSFSQAYKRVANVKEFIRSKQKKLKKQKPSPGTIHIEGTAGPEAAAAVRKLMG
jgi:hypothetical protein